MTTLSSLFLPAVLPTADIVEQSGDHLVTAASNGKTLLLVDTAAQDITLQPYATIAAPVGARIELLVADITNPKTVTAPSGVLLNDVDGATLTLNAAIAAGAVLVQIGVDNWYLSGGVQA
jgi:hypothetical protein